MPRLTRRHPSYRLHKASGNAVVTLDGTDFYLGRFGTPESKAEYDRVLELWLAARRCSPHPPSNATAGGAPGSPTCSDLSINELLVAFLVHAERHYRTRDGRPSGELANFRDTLRPLKRIFGGTIAREFGPLRLKALRQVMIDSGLCRNTINQRITRIVHVFKWAAAEELVSSGVHEAIKKVSGLQKGRSDARESEPVKPVPEAFVDAIEPHVARQIWAMVQLQRLTGMRPGEVVMMRTMDLDTSGRTWVYTPSDHKMAYRDREREVYIGPDARAILKPWLKTDLAAFLFSPGEARAERFAAMRASRKTPVQPSQTNRKKKEPKRRPGHHYTTRTYYHAIVKACERADVPAWHPNQLRHNAGTRLRKEAGLDASRVILGHTSPVVTEVYAEVDREKAIRVMEQIG